MKITANRKEDILRRKAEYEADRERRSAEYDAQYDKYKEAEYAVMEPVKTALEDLMAKYPRLETEVRVEPGMFGNEGLSVHIRVNDRNVHDPSKALSWNYDAHISDGEVVRETGSWSGLQAVTPEQLEHLEQSVGALKELSTLDWMSLLNRERPSYKDYITMPDPRYEKHPDFDTELEQAELEELVGQRKMVEVRPFSGSWYSDPNKSRWSGRNNVYIAIVKDSGSQYTIIECPKYAADRGEASRYFDEGGNTHRVKKSNIVPTTTPITTIDV